MARIRTIKPEFWKSEAIARLPIRARLTFIGLWTYVDDNGVGVDNEKLIVAELFPLEDDPRETLANVSRDIQTLTEEFRIVRYRVGGKRFLAITNWSEHQKIDKPGKARYPGPDQADVVTIAEVTREITPCHSDSRESRESLAEPSRLEQGTGNREQGTGEQGTGEQGTAMSDAGASPPAAPAVRDPDPVDLVFDHWRQVMGHPQAKLDDKRRKAIKAAVKLGYAVDQLRLAIDGCKASPFHQGQNDRGTVYDDLTLIVRSADHIDKFIRLAQQPALTGLSAAARQTVSAAQTWLENSAANETESEKVHEPS